MLDVVFTNNVAGFEKSRSQTASPLVTMRTYIWVLQLSFQFHRRQSFVTSLSAIILRRTSHLQDLIGNFSRLTVQVLTKFTAVFVITLSS